MKSLSRNIAGKQEDRIVQVDFHDTFNNNMIRYSLYILYNRYVPDIRDGLKPVQRRVLYAMFNDIHCTSVNTKRKSANTVGTVIARYHSHGDCISALTAVYLSTGEIKPVGELYNSGIRNFEAMGVNEVNGKTEPVVVRDIRIGQYTNKKYHVMLNNGSEIQCTSNHPFMLKTKEYVKAEDLKPGMVLMSKHYCIKSDSRPAINSEALRHNVYNLPSIDNLLAKGTYGKTLQEMLNYEVNISKDYAEAVAKMQPLCEIVNQPTTQNIPNQVTKNEVITVTNVWIEDVNNEPMYDFTVDTTHNMLFPIVGPYDRPDDFNFICLHNSGVYDAMKCMTNWFEIKIPLINYDSNSGSIQGGPQAAMRYTESYMSKFALDHVIGELKECPKIVDWDKTFDNHTIEPLSLPVQIPLLLVNGCFGIAIGRRIEVPKHSINDVIDATLKVMKNPKAPVVLIPDPCHKCEIIDTDWKKISNTGFGYFTQRGIVEVDRNDNSLHIKSVPDLIWPEIIVEKIEDLIKANKIMGIIDIQDHSTDDQLDIQLIIKKGADPYYIRTVLYQSTPLQDTKRVNMEVVDGVDINRVSYKAYILYFLEERRLQKARLYNFRIQNAKTRLHEIEIYIKILKSGEVEKIVHAIRNQSESDIEALILWLMQKLDITDLQAKFVLKTRLSALSRGNLSKFIREQKDLIETVDRCKNMIINPELIDQEIAEELMYIRKEYGKPRQSILISEGQAAEIPEGEFKIIITEQNFIKKLPLEEPFRSIKGDQAKCMVVGDNSKDILIFDQMGKVFRLPICKIGFAEKGTQGIDVRLLLKKLTSNIICCMYLPILEMLNEKKAKYYLVVVTRQGLIKKIDLADIINTTPSGIFYSKLNQRDEVAEVLIASGKSDIVIYTRSKALRISIDSVPYLKRSTLGNISIKSNEPVDGMSVITSETNELVVVTNKGRFNKLTQSALPRKERNTTGSSVIKLGKGDYIKKIFPCIDNSKIRIIRVDEMLEINTADIDIGSTISPGKKLCKEGILKAELIRMS